MYIGHYSVALALNKVEKKASLGWLFLAVQLVDILLFPLALLGVERINMVENFTQATHFELEFYPYTHSLVGSLGWALAAYLIFRRIPANDEVTKKKVALVIAAAVASHWFLDLIVHTPDLPLLGDASLKLGLGLWNNAAATFTLEALLLLVGVWLYLRDTRAETTTGKYGMFVFAGLLIATSGIAIFGLSPGSLSFLAAFTLITYFGFGGVAFWLDKKRS